MGEKQQDTGTLKGSEFDVRQVAYGILEFLDEEIKNSTASLPEKKDSLEVAMQCVETAFGISLNDAHREPVESLTKLVKQSEQNRKVCNVDSSTSTAIPTTASTGTGTNQSARGLSSLVEISTGAAYIKPAEASAESKKLADEEKTKGNEAMKNEKFGDAVKHYDRAIELDGNNPAFFCNRAAAHLKVDDSESAIRDCQIAIQLHPNYARAYGRMGVAYSTQGKHMDAAICYEKALQLDPGNETYRNNFRISRQMIFEDIPGAFAQIVSSPNVPVPPDVSQIMQNQTLQQMLVTAVSTLRTTLQQRGGTDALSQMLGQLGIGNVNQPPGNEQRNGSNAPETESGINSQTQNPSLEITDAEVGIED